MTSPRNVAQAALLSVLLALMALSGPTPALGQETHTSPSLTDMSIEELMSLRIESVYGA